MIELLRRGPFSRLWWASAASSWGDWTTFFATLALASQIGGTTAVLVPLMSRIIPGLVLGSFAGVIADRLDRKWVMVLSDGGRGVVVLAFVLADDLIKIALISSVLELLTMIRQPAREAAVPTLVAPGNLVAANSFSAAAAYGTAPIGAATWTGLAALFVTLGGWGPIDRGPDLAFVLDSFTFLVSGAIVATIGIPRPTLAEDGTAERRDWRQPLRDLAEGVAFVTQTRTVRRVVFGMAVALFGGSALLPLGQSFALEVLGGGDTGFGVLVTALGVGVGLGMLGVVFFSTDRTRYDLTYALSLGVTGLAIGLTAFARTVFGASGWMLLAGAGTGYAYVMGLHAPPRGGGRHVARTYLRGSVHPGANRHDGVVRSGGAGCLHPGWGLPLPVRQRHPERVRPGRCACPRNRAALDRGDPARVGTTAPASTGTALHLGHVAHLWPHKRQEPGEGLR